MTEPFEATAGGGAALARDAAALICDKAMSACDMMMPGCGWDRGDDQKTFAVEDGDYFWSSMYVCGCSRARIRLLVSYAGRMILKGTMVLMLMWKKAWDRKNQLSLEGHCEFGRYSLSGNHLPLLMLCSGGKVQMYM